MTRYAIPYCPICRSQNTVHLDGVDGDECQSCGWLEGRDGAPSTEDERKEIEKKLKDEKEQQRAIAKVEVTILDHATGESTTVVVTQEVLHGIKTTARQQEHSLPDHLQELLTNEGTPQLTYYCGLVRALAETRDEWSTLDRLLRVLWDEEAERRLATMPKGSTLDDETEKTRWLATLKRKAGIEEEERVEETR